MVGDLTARELKHEATRQRVVGSDGPTPVERLSEQKRGDSFTSSPHPEVHHQLVGTREVIKQTVFCKSPQA